MNKTGVNMRKFNYVPIGDIHLGHPKNDTSYIIKSLKRFLRRFNRQIKFLDAIFITGDLFERALMTDSEDYLKIVKWFSELVTICIANNIKLRLLEGTNSHDSKQPKVLYENYKDIKGLDIKYFNTIDVEYMEEFDINILYVPDVNDKPAKERYSDMRNILKSKGLEKADIAMIHGATRHQLPIITEHTHQEEDLLSIVKYFIHINHIHIPSVYSRILAGGSPERLKHGEEEDKGFIHAQVSEKEEETYFRFIKNTRARVFKTFKFPNKELTNIDIDNLYKELDKLPSTSFIRIITDSKQLKAREILKHYDFSEVKIERPSNKDEVIGGLFDNNDSNIEELEITEDNIKLLLKDEIGNSLSEDELKLLYEYVDEYNNL